MGNWQRNLTLVWSDLRFEWILSLCMALALGAVFAPMFILLGLREGVVGTLLERLDRDPLSRLVTPKYILQAPIEQSWLADLRRRSEVVIASPIAALPLAVDGVTEDVNVLPSSASDPLLVRNGVSAPGDGTWALISQRLAEVTGNRVGDDLTMVLKRSAPDKQRVLMPLPIIGILPVSVTSEAKFWVPEETFRYINDWKRGLPVPALGLSGGRVGLQPEFDGILTLVTRIPSDAEYRSMLAGGGGFSRLPQPVASLGWAVPTGLEARLWMPLGSRIFEDDLPALQARHLERGYEAQVVPYLDGFKVDLQWGVDPVPRYLTVLPQEPEVSAESGGLPPVWVSAADPVGPGAEGSLTFASPDAGVIRVPVRPVPIADLQSGALALPRVLAGRLNAARHQAAVYDPNTLAVFAKPQGDRFFRAYAASIGEVESLVDWVRSQGEATGDPGLKDPISRVDEVRQVQALSRDMRTLYFLIVAVTGVSGFFAVAASVYAGVQRKRRDLAYLQLLGMRRGVLLLVAALKGLALVMGGVAVALGAYAAFAYASGALFGSLGPDSGSLTRLGIRDSLGLIVMITAAAVAASILAASAVMRIDPAEYLRE